jgi:hypothetical protein
VPRIHNGGYNRRIRPTLGSDSITAVSGNRSNTVKGAGVYFLAAVDLGRVKIGRAKEVRKRVAALRNSSPVPLELLGTIPGGAAVEAYLHAAFAQDRSHGEWFELTEAIENVVETGELPPCRSGIRLAQLSADGELFRRFARIEQAIAAGRDTPSTVASAAGCSVEQAEEAMRMMLAFGFMRGNRDPNTEIFLVP